MVVPKSRVVFVTLILIFSVAAGVLILNNFFFRGENRNQPSTQSTSSSITKENPNLGSASNQKAISIIVYLDLLCPDCERAHREILPRIIKDYVDTNKAKVSYKILGTYGPESMSAGNATYCANEQGKMLDFIKNAYEIAARSNNVSPFSNIGLTNIARKTSLKIPEWQDCVSKSKYTSKINKNKQEVLDTGGYGTPHFIIEGKGYNGAPPYDIFVPVIESAIAEKVK